MYLVEGLADGRFAVIQKTHYAMVDGINAIDIGQVILDTTPIPREIPEDLWMPQPEPAAADPLLDAVGEIIRRPTAVVDTVRIGLADARNVASRLAAVGGVLSAARIAARPAPNSPLNAEIGSQRRFAVARTELEDYRKVRKQTGGTVNDVVLATVAGAVRGWMLSRGEAVTPATRYAPWCR